MDTCTGPEPNLDRPLRNRPFRSGRTGKRLRRKTNGWKKRLCQLNRSRKGYLREFTSPSYNLRERHCRENKWWGVFRIASSWIARVLLIMELSFFFSIAVKGIHRKLRAWVSVAGWMHGWVDHFLCHTLETVYPRVFQATLRTIHRSYGCEIWDTQW